MTETTGIPGGAELKDHETSGKLMRAATLAAVATAVFLVIIKFFGWLMTGSVALLGSLIDSLMDGLASTLNFIAVRHSLQPPDSDHRFGHGKAEALAGLGQFAFITGSAAFLALESIERLFNPAALQSTQVGYLVIVIAIIATLALVLFQRFVVRRTNSLAIGADELHYRSDLLMNIGVIIAIALNSSGWFESADAIFGLVIAGFLAFSAMQIMRRSYDELMDKEFDPAERQKIKDLVKGFPKVLDMHDLRTRRSGLRSFVQLHLEMDGEMTLNEAHQIADEVEAKIMDLYSDAEVIIHQDPVGLEDPGHLART